MQSLMYVRQPDHFYRAVGIWQDLLKMHRFAI